MKIPKVFHPVLGVLTGILLFLAGIAVLSAVFVATYKAVRYAGHFVSDAFSDIVSYLSQWLPL